MHASSENYRHQGMRRRLVDVLRKRGIADEAVLAAIGSVPRHLFIDDTAFLTLAYEDNAFPIACGQTISQPYTVAIQTELLGVKPGHRVLEVGTGSGYQTAVLVHLGCKVFSIERHKPLYLQTKDRLARLGIRATLFHGDGYAGLPKEAPFDRIIVTCGAPEVPEQLVQQLRDGGRMVIPVGEGEVQRMLVINRDLHGAISRSDKGAFRFVPMLKDKAV